jgi:hypothetical protein
VNEIRIMLVLKATETAPCPVCDEDIVAGDHIEARLSDDRVVHAQPCALEACSAAITAARARLAEEQR